jgi:hypothetical protein
MQQLCTCLSQLRHGLSQAAAPPALGRLFGPYGRRHAPPHPPRRKHPARLPAARYTGAGGMGLADSGGGDHAVSERHGPLCVGSAPRDRHCGRHRHAGGRRGGWRGSLRGDGRFVGADGERPHGRRPLRHLLPPPVVDVRPRGRPGRDRPAPGRRGGHRQPIRDCPAPALRRARRGEPPRLPRPVGLPASPDGDGAAPRRSRTGAGPGPGEPSPGAGPASGPTGTSPSASPAAGSGREAAAGSGPGPAPGSGRGAAAGSGRRAAAGAGRRAGRRAASSAGGSARARAGRRAGPGTHRRTTPRARGGATRLTRQGAGARTCGNAAPRTCRGATRRARGRRQPRTRSPAAQPRGDRRSR